MSQDVRSGGITDGNMRDEPQTRRERQNQEQKTHHRSVGICRDRGGGERVLVSNYQISLPKVELSCAFGWRGAILPAVAESLLKLCP